MYPRALPITSISRLLFLCLLLGLNGCSTWVGSDFRKPEVQLLKVDVIKAKLVEQRFMLHFRIDNPNDFSLPVRGMAYTLHLNGIKLADGQSSTWLTVPARGRATFKVPVNTNLWRHVKRVVKMLEEPDEPIRYRLSADIETGLLFGQSVHLTRDGEIIPANYIPE